MQRDHTEKIAEMISEYRKQNNGDLYKKILSEIRKVIYFMPMECLGLQEEDSAEFLLNMEGRLNGIVEGFKEEYGDFAAYIYPILERNVRGFKKQKNKRRLQETSILYSQSAYEFTLNENDNSIENLFAYDNNQPYDIEEDMTIVRLKTTFQHIPITRDRFYVYFIALAVHMRLGLIYNVCRRLNFDYPETVRLVKHLKEGIPPGREDLSHAIDKRNEYFGKLLFLEQELADLNYLSDHSKDEQINSQIEKIRSYGHNKIQYIQSQKKRVSRSALAEILHKSEGTIASYMLFSHQLTEWCTNPDLYKGCKDLRNKIGINQSAATAILKKAKIPCDISFEVLKPFEKFHINTALNC